MFARGHRVICRTRRGLEIGEVLTEVDTESPTVEDIDPHDEFGGLAGRVLRRMTDQDELLVRRLEKNRIEAMDACATKIREWNLDVALIDAEQLFDGKSIFFYFLGDTTPRLEQLTNELAEAYESKVRFRQFTDAVEQGCGPGCGTEESAGCSTGGGCGSCAISGSCGK